MRRCVMDRPLVARIGESVAQMRKRGHSVFLCHDIHPTTVNNFPAFLDEV